MANEFYQPGEGRASQVQALFATIAPRYDLINDLQSFGMHRHWKKRVLQLSAVKLGERVLDICCGTGDIAFGLAKAGAIVTALDFNEAMLRVAEQRREKSDLRTGISFVRGDAQQLPFADASFDVVTVGYGLRNLADWEKGVAEMVRVARPGAKIISLDFGKPDNSIWRALYFGYLRAFVPLLGLIFCRKASAYAYILESLKQYPAQRGVEDEMKRIGLANVRVHNILGGAMSINYGEKKIK
jgi:demethylmenaquinone methyltransferase/2-methoxy-6-polyprenyl-1,4-benzoquinol methylase